MQTLLMSRDEIGRIAENLYETKIRFDVETPENIGRFVIIDPETGDYAVDDDGIGAARSLQAKRPYPRLYGIRIGYKTAATIGGVMERIPR